MNQFSYIYPNNFESCLLNELKKMNEILKEINKNLEEKKKNPEMDYLQKDNTYHMI